MVSREHLQSIKRNLAEHYGDRLRGVVLFGSEARGNADEGSDVDLMVLLDGPVDTGREIREITDRIYHMQIERGFFRPVEVIPVDVDDYRNVNLGIYRNAREEGVAV